MLEWTGLKCIKDTVEVKEIVNISPANIVIHKDTNEKFSGKFSIKLNDTPFDQEERIHNQKLQQSNILLEKTILIKNYLKIKNLLLV